MKPIYAQRGDTVLTHSSSLLGRLIRWGETDPGETNGTWANHAGVVVEDGWIVPPENYGYGLVRDAEHFVYDSEGRISPKLAVVVEALGRVRRGPLKLNGIEVRVFRPIPAYTEEEKQRLVTYANRLVGNRYGWWKLIGFLIKRATGGRVDPTQLYFIHGRPVCSYLAAWGNEVARATGTVIRIVLGVKTHWPGFGMPPQAADPDEMLDFCEAHPEFWDEVK